GKARSINRGGRWWRMPYEFLMGAGPTKARRMGSGSRARRRRGGAGASGRHKKSPPAPAARMIRPSATITPDLRLSMALPPLDEKRGHHREREVNDGEGPQSAPVVRHLPQACAQLIDPNHPVDGEIRREYVAAGKHGFWDCFARPGKARQKELRKAGAEEDERRSLRMLEPSTHRLAHEAGRENEDRRQRE